MSAFPANPSQIDVLDTYYQFIYANMQILNPQQVMHGLIGVQDWPPVDLDLTGGLYLLHLTSPAVSDRSQPAQQFMEHFVQWNWAIQGQDIQSANVDPNRGSRWRSYMALQELIGQVHFPGFCAKKAIAGYDPVAASGMFTPYSPNEMVYWTNPKCSERQDKASGLLYGTATLQVYAYSTTSPLLDQ